ESFLSVIIQYPVYWSVQSEWFEGTIQDFDRRRGGDSRGGGHRATGGGAVDGETRPLSGGTVEHVFHAPCVRFDAPCAREEIDPPPKELFAEVEASSRFREAVEEVDWIERRWGKALPDAEKRYLIIHYISLLQKTEV